MYALIRRLFFRLDAEQAHYLAMNGFSCLCRLPGLRQWLKSYFSTGENPVEVSGIRFKNRIGLGAGFDKNARYLDALLVLGFGAVEIGTVTPLPQAGNERPRLFRLPADEALINRMGFNNDGMERIAQRLKIWRQRHPIGKSDLIIGGNIGKNKQTPNEQAWQDYEACFLHLREWVDYFTVNVSSPNTPGLRALQDKESLRKIFTVLQEHNQQQKPIFLKIAPDLTEEQVKEILELTQEVKIDGLVVSNTSITREGLQTPVSIIETIGAGGLSGRPIRHQSTRWIRYIREHGQKELPIIGSGGIFTAADATEKLNAGATLLQVWTGFIYVGPNIVKKIGKAV
jgi:dihydroorotate dehydrogenase